VPGTSIRNQLTARVLTIDVEPAGAYAEVLLELPGTPAQRLRARITRESVARLGLQPGQAVCALIKAVSFDRRAVPG
jgi:molybdate transport system ATP-binding protein